MNFLAILHVVRDMIYQDISRIVRTRSYIAASAGPIGVEELAARLVYAFVGVGTKVVSLGLEQVGGESFAPITIIECQRT